MYKEVLRSIENIEIFPVVSLVIFVGFFAIVLIGTFKTKQSTIDELSNIPLNDDNEGIQKNDKNTQPC